MPGMIEITEAEALFFKKLEQREAEEVEELKKLISEAKRIERGLQDQYRILTGQTYQGA